MASWRFEIFVDEGCSMCSRESRLMRRLDRGRGRLRITDLAGPDFPAQETGLTVDQAMRSIHGRFPDGRVIEGVDVFVAAYDAVGWGLPLRLTRLPLLKSVVDRLYSSFARRRYRRRVREGCALPLAESAHSGR